MVSILNRGPSVSAAWNFPSRSRFAMSCKQDSSDNNEQVLNHDWIDHAPPEAGTETDWFSVQCLYAIVISSAAEMLYTQRALRQSLIEREQKLKTAFDLLEGWRKHLPNPLQEIHKQNTHLILDDHCVRDVTLSVFRQYHEAIFMICFPWAANRSDGRVSEDCRRKSVELCVNSAQVVLAIANQILNLDMLDRYARTCPFAIRDNLNRETENTDNS